MRCLIRTGLCLAFMVGWGAGDGEADLPNPYEFCSVPDGLTLSPGTLHGTVGTFSFCVSDAYGPVIGVEVVVELSPYADSQVAWCIGQVHPIQVGFTDNEGVVYFTWKGGGCVEPGSEPENSFIVRITVDGEVAGEAFISSPDVVGYDGLRASELGAPICGENPVGSGNYRTGVDLGDAVEFTKPIQQGLMDPCCKLIPGPEGSYLAPVSLGDAVHLTPYVVEGTSCQCQAP